MNIPDRLLRILEKQQHEIFLHALIYGEVLAEVEHLRMWEMCISRVLYYSALGEYDPLRKLPYTRVARITNEYGEHLVQPYMATEEVMTATRLHNAYQDLEDTGRRMLEDLRGCT